MNVEEIKSRCEWLIERRQGDSPVWTSDMVYPILSDYLRVLDDLGRVRTGVS